MMEDRRVLWAIVGTVALILAVVFLSEPVQRELRPEPQRAFIAFEVDGEGVARPGRVTMPPDGRLDLHAVLEARGRGGRRLFFTRAPALEIDGEVIAAEDLRPWKGPEEVKVLWFTVEGPRPFVRLAGDQTLSALAFKANFRPQWPRAWSVPGSIRPAREEAAPDPDSPRRRVSFGTQRYQVRIELFGSGSALVPVATYESPPPAEVADEVDRFPTVVAALPGALELPSKVFGLTQVDMTGGDILEREARALNDWFNRDLVFSRLLLLRAMLDSAGVSWETLEWRAVELAAGPDWGAGSVSAGHLLRAGERVVVLYEDRGVAGKLDYEDLCMDFWEGAEVRPLSDIFVGEGLVEWTALAPA